MARRHGWSDEQINGLNNFEQRADFTESEKAALRLTEQVTRDGHSVDDALWNELRTHFDEGELVELLCTIGLFNYFNRFNDALQVEPTK